MAENEKTEAEPLKDCVQSQYCAGDRRQVRFRSIQAGGLCFRSFQAKNLSAGGGRPVLAGTLTLDHHARCAIKGDFIQVTECMTR